MGGNPCARRKEARPQGAAGRGLGLRNRIGAGSSGHWAGISGKGLGRIPPTPDMGGDGSMAEQGRFARKASLTMRAA
jgi:hypothetical protein